jgi:hypothetical protein
VVKAEKKLNISNNPCMADKSRQNIFTWNSISSSSALSDVFVNGAKEVPVSLVTQGTVNLMESVNEGGLFWTTYISETGSRDTTSIKWLYNLKPHHQPVQTQPSLHLLLLLYKPQTLHDCNPQ